MVAMAELDWMTYQTKVSADDAILFLPIGALEQHGPHMSMNPDVLIPQAISETVSRNLHNAMVAPPIAYGYKSQQQSGGGNHLPGTTSLDGITLAHTIRDVIKELARHGARKIVMMNGHYENSMFVVEGIDLAIRELRWEDVKDINVMILSYWDFIGDETIERLYPDGFTGWALEHGGVLETSLMLYLHPHLVDMGKVIDHPPAEFPPYDMFPVEPELTPTSGTLSSAKNASREKGEIIMSVCVEGIARAVSAKFQSNAPASTPSVGAV